MPCAANDFSGKIHSDTMATVPVDVKKKLIVACCLFKQVSFEYAQVLQYRYPGGKQRQVHCFALASERWVEVRAVRHAPDNIIPVRACAHGLMVIPEKQWFP